MLADLCHLRPLMDPLFLLLAPANPKVFFYMTVDAKPAGMIVMELFADTTPRTAENFRALCTGEKCTGKLGKPLHYKGSIIHHVDPCYMIAGGDIIDGGKGNRGECIYGSRFFEVENFIKKHTGPGILSKWNRGRNSTGSQFMIHAKANSDLDNECVVFGQVVQGMYVVTSIMALSTNTSIPVAVISNCGQIS
ncbi:unnamed protein product [Brassica rapa]|uniref:Peptidyl-prolyl cis-trans isomerase n=2 Tax=Brassica TaxID=3705 RepID=A0A078JUD2_BRANA|nr:unnamed protein product [Brassica napus]CAG7889677.1 unnamed protein product [Brassica rapa]CDY70394.1 BnaA01g36700D [Brassica napus]VDC77008.1 unnamed protein product [Brassica rapa]